MADVQPHYSMPVHRDIPTALNLAGLSLSEHKVAWAILRASWGWNSSTTGDRLTRRALEELTGIRDRKQRNRALQGLLEKGVVEKVADYDDRRSRPAEWAIVKDYDQWRAVPRKFLWQQAPKTPRGGEDPEGQTTPGEDARPPGTESPPGASTPPGGSEPPGGNPPPGVGGSPGGEAPPGVAVTPRGSAAPEGGATPEGVETLTPPGDPHPSPRGVRSPPHKAQDQAQGEGEEEARARASERGSDRSSFLSGSGEHLDYKPGEEVVGDGAVVRRWTPDALYDAVASRDDRHRPAMRPVAWNTYIPTIVAVNDDEVLAEVVEHVRENATMSGPGYFLAFFDKKDGKRKEQDPTPPTDSGRRRRRGYDPGTRGAHPAENQPEPVYSVDDTMKMQELSREEAEAYRNAHIAQIEEQGRTWREAPSVL